MKHSARITVLRLTLPLKIFIRNYVTPQDSSPPSVVHKRFFPAGCAAAGCTARRKKGASRHRRFGIRHLRSYEITHYSVNLFVSVRY